MGENKRYYHKGVGVVVVVVVALVGYGIYIYISVTSYGWCFHGGLRFSFIMSCFFTCGVMISPQYSPMRVPGGNGAVARTPQPFPPLV